MAGYAAPPTLSGPSRHPSRPSKSTIPASWSSWTVFCIGRRSGTKGTVGQSTAIDVASASTWATLQVTRRNPRRSGPAPWPPGGPLCQLPGHHCSLGTRHSVIRAGRPPTNGCVERVQQTILDECWKPAFARYLIPKQTGLRLDLERYLRYYNTERAHTGRWTRGRTPEEVLGKAKLWQRKR